MQFAIEGYDPSNFGDLLMAAASIKLANAAVPNSRFFLPREIPLPPEVVSNAAEQISWGKPNARRYLFWGRPRSTRKYRISESTRSMSGSVVLYCCGYVFGDFWPRDWIEGLAEDFAALRRNGNKIVLMPQSFGPFERPELAEASLRALEHADLIWARDSESFAYAKKLAPSLPVAPLCDYTGALSETRETSYSANRICVVPNIKILEKYGDTAKTRYFDLISKICKLISGKNRCSIEILKHTATADNRIAAELAHVLAPLRAKLVEPLDCYDAKRFIANSRFLLSSRFHGLVNGLTQRVPSLAIGWTHKYDGILEMYGQQKYSLLPDAPRWDSIVEDFLNNETNIRAELGVRHASIEASIYPQISRAIANVASVPSFGEVK
jgi:colanic acid/amylovoran biosynthesis protein